MSELDLNSEFEYPEGFQLPYNNPEERNGILNMKIEMLDESIIHEGVSKMLKK